MEQRKARVAAFHLAEHHRAEGGDGHQRPYAQPSLQVAPGLGYERGTAHHQGDGETDDGERLGAGPPCDQAGGEGRSGRCCDPDLLDVTQSGRSFAGDVAAAVAGTAHRAAS